VIHIVPLFDICDIYYSSIFVNPQSFLILAVNGISTKNLLAICYPPNSDVLVIPYKGRNNVVWCWVIYQTTGLLFPT